MTQDRDAITPEPQESQLVLILDDDVMITEGLAAGLEREGRTVITCNDLESAQLIVERLNPSHIVADVRLTGPFGYEGLDFIRYARRHSPESRIIVMTGDAPEALQLEASERGAVAFLQKPFDVGALDSTLNLLSCSALSFSADQAPVIRMPLLSEILSSEALLPLFQPIIDMRGNGERIGYEALARYRDHPLLRNPEFLFQYAARKNRVADLELACVTRSLRVGANLAHTGFLFLNIHPEVFSSGRDLIDVLERDSKRFGVNLQNVVLEVTEQASLHADPSVLKTFDQLRSLGVRFAFDDVGVAYSHLPFIGKVKPSFLKISQHFGTAFETDPTKLKIVMNLQALARDFDCDLILEGVEHASTAAKAAELGIRYGQGFFFSHPAEAADLLAAR